MTDQTITLKEYFNDKFEQVIKSTALALASLEKRLDGMNEFRGTLKDQNAKFITRDEFNLVVDRLKADIRNLEIAKAILEGKASQESVEKVGSKAQWGIIFGAIGTSLALINFVTKVTGH